MIVGLLTFAGIALWYGVSREPEGRLEARFLGYAFEPPTTRRNSAGQGARVARFLITNGCDFPVHCALSARYTNGAGSFSPRDISLEAHVATNVAGLAGLSFSARASPLQLRVPSWADSVDWTNSWRLMVAYRKAPPLEGIGEMRYRMALWLIRKKMLRLGRLLNPVEIHVAETDLIAPDVPVSGNLD